MAMIKIQLMVCAMQILSKPYLLFCFSSWGELNTDGPSDGYRKIFQTTLIWTGQKPVFYKFA